MSQENRAFLQDTCAIERPNIAVDASTITDLRVSSYTTIKAIACCWFEFLSTRYEYHPQLGQQPIETYRVHFLPDEDVKGGDRLLKGTTRYLVHTVQDFALHGAHLSAIVEEQKIAMT